MNPRLFLSQGQDQEKKLKMDFVIFRSKSELTKFGTQHGEDMCLARTFFFARKAPTLLVLILNIRDHGHAEAKPTTTPEPNTQT